MKRSIFFALVVFLPLMAAGEEETSKVKGSAGLGYTQSGGNTNSTAVNLDSIITYDGAMTDLTGQGGLHYGFTRYTNQGILSTNNYFVLGKIDQYLASDKITYAFVQLQFQSDQFSGFWGKYMAETGLGRKWWKTDKGVFKTELGYAFIDWNYTEPNSDGHWWEQTHNGVARALYKHQLTDWLTIGQEAVYYVDFNDTENYQAESRSSAAIKLNSHLSFQSSVTVKYNNMPPLVAKTDVYGTPLKDPAGAPILEKAEYLDYIWSNALTVSFP